MILVVHGWKEFFVFTSPVKMPLFFAISGYLFNPRGGAQQKFYHNIFIKLVVPWLVLGLFPYTNPLDRLLALLSGKVLWFMPCLIYAEILWFYSHKYANSRFHIFCTGIILSAIGLAMHNYNILRYGMINTAFIVQVFFVLGYFIRLYEDKLGKRWNTWMFIAIIIYFLFVYMTMYYFPGSSLDVHTNRYYNLPICVVLIFTGITILFTLFRKKELAPQWLVYIGQNTLIIYILHSFCLGGFHRLSILYPPIASIPLPLYGIIDSCIAIISCCLLAKVVNKYAPFIVGKKVLTL